ADRGPKISAGCTTATFSSGSDLDVAYATGEAIQYLPESLFSSGQLKDDCVTGPIEATLTVVDNNGFTSTSQPLLIAPDSNMAPVTSITATPSLPPTCMTTCTESVSIEAYNIFGNPASGVVITAIPTSGDVTTGPAGTTDASGTVTFTVSWPLGGGGEVQFDTGALPPVSVSFS